MSEIADDILEERAQQEYGQQQDTDGDDRIPFAARQQVVDEPLDRHRKRKFQDCHDDGTREIDDEQPFMRLIILEKML